MNCRDCKYWKTVLGSAHISCDCPRARAFTNDPAIQMLGIMSKRLDVQTLLAFMLVAKLSGVELNHHGVEHGWACWPISFDPIWIENCENFEEKRDAELNPPDLD